MWGKEGLCRVFSPAAPIFVVQGTVVGTARQNIECSELAAQLFQTQQ
jgi:hypothetical protein